MSVTEITEGEIFTVRTYKTYVGYSWANSYEVQAETDIPLAYTSLEDMSNRFTNLEAAIHLDGVIIDRVVISTYVPDGEPYSPSSFVVFPKSVVATAPVPDQVAPLELCVYVRRNVENGRFGRLFYRGCLTEAGLVSPAFRPQLTGTLRSTLQTAFNTWLAGTGPGPGFRLVLARGTPTPTNVRPVNGLVVENRVVVKQLRNRYFDIP